MAHEITATDNLFTVRKPGWHGLGETLAEYPTREEAQKIAHPWEPISEPVYLGEPTVEPIVSTHTGGVIETVPGMRYDEVEGYQALRRSDNGHLLGIVSNTYTPVLNDEMWDIAEALQGSGQDVRYETGGSLAGGKKVWLLLRLNEPLTIAGDPRGETIPYYALQNSHDGSGAFRGQAVVTRIVCANTSHIADLDARARGTEFTFRHTKNIGQRVEEARDALRGWRDSLEDWKQLCELDLLPRRVDESQVIDFLDAFIPEPEADIVSERVRRNIADERAKWLEVHRGITGEGIERTAYGLVAASIEYAEHYRRARSAETRFKRAYLDRSGVVESAARIAREVAPV